MKRLASLLLVLMLALFFVGCGDEQTPEEKEREELSKITITLENDQFTKDTELISKVQTVYDVTWEVEDNEYCKVEEKNGSIYLVLLKTGGREIKLTATIHGLLEGVSVTKEFKIYTNIIKSEEITIEKFMTSAVGNGSTVTIKGTVYEINESGYWITDAEDSYLFVYTKTSENKDKNGVVIKVGNEIEVKGDKKIFYSMYELENSEANIIAEVSDYDISKLASTSTIEDVLEYAYIEPGKGYTKHFGKIFEIEGILIADKFDSGYTYNIESIKTKQALVIYNSVMNDAEVKNLEDNLGKYVKMTCILYDTHSSGYVRIYPVKDVVATEKPVLTDQEIVDAIAYEINGMDLEIATDVEFPTTMDGATLTWTSSNPEYLSNNGEVLKQDTQNNVEAKVTCVITLNDVSKTVELTFTILPITTTTVLETTKKALTGKESIYQVEAKVIEIDTVKYGYFYIADASGISYVRSEMSKFGIEKGKSYKLLVKTTLYLNSNKEVTPQLNVISAEELTTEVQICDAVEVDIEKLAERKTAQTTLLDTEIKALASDSLYGQLVKFRCYISVRTSGSYTNVYLAVSTKATDNAAYYQHTSQYQDELKALDGKYVEIIAPVYGYHATYGWRIGTYLSVTVIE